MRKIRNLIEKCASKPREVCTICGNVHRNEYMPYCSNLCASEALKRIPRTPEFNDKFNVNSTQYIRDIFGIVETLHMVPCAQCGSHTTFIHRQSMQFMCSPTCINTMNSLAKTPYTDPHLHSHINVSRLINEYDNHGRLIIAYDYDSTVYDYHNTGSTYDKVKELLRKADKIGCYLIVYTCSGEDRYPEIEKYLKENDVPFHAINENCPDITFAQNKLYYNILLDDRAGLASAYADLEVAIDAITHKNKEAFEKNVKNLQEWFMKGMCDKNGNTL